MSQCLVHGQPNQTRMKYYVEEREASLVLDCKMHRCEVWLLEATWYHEECQPEENQNTVDKTLLK